MKSPELFRNILLTGFLATFACTVLPHPLLEAIESEDYETARAYVESHEGEELDVANEKGRTALHLLVRKKDDIESCMDLMGLLIERGADVDYQDAYEYTPLTLAAYYGGDVSLVELLLVRGGANPEIPDRHGCAPIYWAACMGHPDVVRVLCDRKVNLDALNETGISPLAIAVAKGHKGIVEEITSRGGHYITRSSKVLDFSLLGHRFIIVRSS